MGLLVVVTSLAMRITDGLDAHILHQIKVDFLAYGQEAIEVDDRTSVANLS